MPVDPIRRRRLRLALTLVLLGGICTAGIVRRLHVVVEYRNFAGDGWHVTDRRDRIWYALPRLTSGYVEFTLANVTMASLTDTSDSEIFSMYEAGYGIAEPIRYAPEFRENHYKCMLRLYANGETSRAGQQKLMWGMCPGGEPGYGSCACGSFFEEPFGAIAKMSRIIRTLLTGSQEPNDARTMSRNRL